MQKHYPSRKTVELTKLQPFGLKCWVYRKKPIRDKDFSGKSDKNPRSKEEINLYAKNYYHLKGRQLIRCECCDREVVKSNFLKHTKTKSHKDKENLIIKDLNIIV